MLRTVRNQKGIALFVALLFSMAIMVMVTGMLYVVDRNTEMTGAGKRYATAEEAADGAVNVVKDSINMAIWGDLDTVNTLFPGTCDNNGSSMSSAILAANVPCEKALTLAGLDGTFSAVVTAERLYSISMPGSRIEFAKSAGGAPGTAIFFRIDAVVTGPKNARAESSALYRFAG